MMVTAADLADDPHPHLHRSRSAGPVAWIDDLDAWLVVDHAAADLVMRDSERFTVDHPGFSTAQVVGESMLSLDGVEHRRHRRSFDRPFRRKAVEERFAPTVDGDVDALVSAIETTGRSELRRSVCGPLAVAQMTTALGLGHLPVATVLGWYDAIVAAVDRVTAGEEVPNTGRTAFDQLRSALLAAIERARSGDGGTAVMLATAAGDLDDVDQTISNAAVLLFGGIETTEGMIANALYYLLTVEGLADRVRADRGLLPLVIEESLRMEPAAAVVDRYATANVEIGGASIAAGDLVRVSLSAANRDPAVFVDPDRFDPDRPNLAEHVAFARGPHVCLGIHLARLEAERLVWALIKRLPNLRLDPEAADRARPRGLVFRKPEALMVEWDAVPTSR